MHSKNSLTVSHNKSIVHSSNEYNSNTLLVNTSQLTDISYYFSKISSSTTISYPTGIMPPGVLAITDNCVVYERPPQYQNIQIIFDQVDNINYERSKTRIYRIPIPWQIYIATYSSFNNHLYPNNVRMYFMNSSIHNSSYDTAMMYLPPLPNFYANGLLCRPMFSDSEDVNRYSNDISGIISATYDWIWNSGTNMDLTMACVELFLQSRHNRDKNYIIPNSYPSEVALSSYYVSAPAIHSLLTHWESLDALHEISNYDWPFPAPVERPSSEPMYNRSDYLDEYLHRFNLEDYHSCDPDYENCECTPHYDDDHFYEYVRTSFFSPKTFQDIMRYVYRDELVNLSHRSLYTDYFSKYIENSALSLAN